MVRLTHPLLGAAVRAQIERAASEYRGRRWVSQGFTSLDDRASHPCGVLRGAPFSVFAKLGAGPDAREQFTAELAGLRLISPAVPVPVPVAGGLADTEASGLTDTEAGVLLLYEALPERPPGSRSRAGWRSIGHVLATLHQVRHERFGLDGPRGFFGPLPQDNRPVPANQWTAFFRDRRLLPLLRAAADSGHLPPGLAPGGPTARSTWPPTSGGASPPGTNCPSSSSAWTAGR
jgi:fructosamine-3-kinase